MSLNRRRAFISLLIGLSILPFCEPNRAAMPFVRLAEYKSKFHPVEISYRLDWRIYNKGEDTSENFFVGMVADADRSFYYLRIRPDHPPEELSDATVYEYQKKNVLDRHSSNNLVDEADVKLHGAQFHHLRFDSYDTGRNRRECIDIYTRRTGKWRISIHMSFPHQAELKKDTLPPAILSELDRGILVFESAATR